MACIKVPTDIILHDKIKKAQVRNLAIAAKIYVSDSRSC